MPGAAGRCRMVSAVHGLDARDGEFVLVGGAHAELKQRVVEALAMAGFEARQDDDPAHSGASAANIFNRFGAGVRLEISRPLRERLLEGGDDLEEFAARVRGVLAEYGAAKAASVEEDYAERYGTDDRRLFSRLPEPTDGWYVRPRRGH